MQSQFTIIIRFLITFIANKSVMRELKSTREQCIFETHVSGTHKGENGFQCIHKLRGPL